MKKRRLLVSSMILCIGSYIYCQNESLPVDAGTSFTTFIEGSIAYALKENKQSKIIGGFGIYNAIVLDTFYGQHKSMLGIGLPFRYQLTSNADGELLGYRHNLSFATLVKLSIQQNTGNEKLWFFMALGPGISAQWKSDPDKTKLFPSICQEFGLRIYAPTSVISDSELGFAVNWPVQKKAWKEKLLLASIFYRIAVF